MTFSIAAYCPATGQVGVASLTAMMGVGKLVAHARARVGAVATQAHINPYLAYDGLTLLGHGRGPEATLGELVEADPGADFRQCGMVDARGGSAAWTGPRTPHWAGDLTDEGVAVQGNRLVGPETLEAVMKRFSELGDHPLHRRLLEAVHAGEETGADKEGAVSATISVYDTEEYPLWDVRVDAADDPVVRLRELVDAFEQDLVPLIEKLPTRADPLGQEIREQGRAIG